MTLKLKLQYFGHMKRRANSLEKTPMLGKVEGRRNSMDLSLSKLWEIVKDWEAWRATVHGVETSRTQLSN